MSRSIFLCDQEVCFNLAVETKVTETGIGLTVTVKFSNLKRTLSLANKDIALL